MKKIDAQNRTIGRVATEVAKILMGKNSVDYRPNVVSKEKVQIINASKVNIPAKKLTDKEYQRYTGHPGGLRKINLEELIQKKGYGEVFKKTVYGMLPDNKLRSLRMKNLEILD